MPCNVNWYCNYFEDIDLSSSMIEHMGAETAVLDWFLCIFIFNFKQSFSPLLKIWTDLKWHFDLKIKKSISLFLCWQRNLADTCMSKIYNCNKYKNWKDSFLVLYGCITFCVIISIRNSLLFKKIYIPRDPQLHVHVIEIFISATNYPSIHYS